MTYTNKSKSQSAELLNIQPTPPESVLRKSLLREYRKRISSTDTA